MPAMRVRFAAIGMVSWSRVTPSFRAAAKIGYEAGGEMARLDLSTTGSDLSRVSQIAASLGFRLRWNRLKT